MYSSTLYLLTTSALAYTTPEIYDKSIREDSLLFKRQAGNNNGPTTPINLANCDNLLNNVNQLYTVMGLLDGVTQQLGPNSPIAGIGATPSSTNPALTTGQINLSNLNTYEIAVAAAGLALNAASPCPNFSQVNSALATARAPWQTTKSQVRAQQLSAGVNNAGVTDNSAGNTTPFMADGTPITLQKLNQIAPGAALLTGIVSNGGTFAQMIQQIVATAGQTGVTNGNGGSNGNGKGNGGNGGNRNGILNGNLGAAQNANGTNGRAGIPPSPTTSTPTKTASASSSKASAPTNAVKSVVPTPKRVLPSPKPVVSTSKPAVVPNQNAAAGNTKPAVQKVTTPPVPIKAATPKAVVINPGAKLPAKKVGKQ